MSDIKLIIKSIPIPAEGFSEEICRGSPADEARYSEETRDARRDFLEKLRLFVLFFFTAIVMRCIGYLAFAFTGNDV